MGKYEGPCDQSARFMEHSFPTHYKTWAKKLAQEKNLNHLEPDLSLSVNQQNYSEFYERA